MDKHAQLTQKTLVRFAKTGPAIYHSHHDMLRFWERAAKRAELPLRLTQGFNPRPRMIFPHALGVGIASRQEIVVLELYARHDVRDLLTKLRAACGDTLEILDAENMPPVKKSPQLVASSYLITGWTDDALRRLPELAEQILAMPAIPVERGAPGEKRQLDIRPFVKSLRADARGLVLELHHNQAGSGRPDEIAKLSASLLAVDPHTLAIEKTGMSLD